MNNHQSGPETPSEVRSQEAQTPTQEFTRRDDLPAFDCRICGQPFAREDWRALHYGLEHPDKLDEEEIASFRAAYDAESETLYQYRFKTLGMLVVLYFTLLIIYAAI